MAKESRWILRHLKNITRITAAQYQNAALTAGITDAKLTVASAVPIDGSGALAGVLQNR